MEMIKKEFKIYSPLSQKSVQRFKESLLESEESSERILLEGIASTTNRDLHNEIVSEEAIKEMAESAKLLNIHGDHWYGLNDVIGAIKEATVEDATLKIKFLITKEFTPKIQDLLETGVHLGLSIGGWIKEYDEELRIIKSFDLKEISLTAMPANWDSFGTVTTAKGLVKSNCLTGACHTILKTIEDDNMAENNEEVFTEEKATQLFNELFADAKEELIKTVVDEVKSDVENIIDEKINGESNSNSEKDEDEDKSIDTEELSKSIVGALTSKMGEMVDAQIKSYVQNNSNPTPTPTPQGTQKEGGEVNSKKTYTNKEILERMNARARQNSIFNLANR